MLGLYPAVFKFGRLSLSFYPFGVCDSGCGKLSVELFPVVVIPLEEVLSIIRGNRREEDVVNVFGEYDDVVVRGVWVFGHYLEPEFQVVFCDAKAVGTDEDQELIE